MSVIAIYGDRPMRYLDMPAIRVSSTQIAGPPGHLYMPGPHDLQAVAAVLNGAVPGEHMPMWDLVLGSTVTGECVDSELHPSTQQLLQRIVRGEHPTTLVVEHPWLWYPMVLRHFAQPRPDTNQLYIQAQAQVRVAETMGLLANSGLAIVLVADETPLHAGNGIPTAYRADLPRGMREYVTHEVRVVGDLIVIDRAPANRDDLRALFGAPYIVKEEQKARPIAPSIAPPSTPVIIPSAAVPTVIPPTPTVVSSPRPMPRPKSVAPAAE
jgi:hypothetical protein